MGWKEFFKPDWKKIVIAIILTALTYLETYGHFGYGHFGGGFIGRIGQFLIRISQLPFILILSILWNSESPALLIFGYYIFPFIFWYLLSCVIVWIIVDIYNNVRKNTVKKKK